MQTAANGEAEDACVQEFHRQIFGCEVRRAMEEIDTELAVVELGHHFYKQAFLLAFKRQEVVSSLLDRY